MTVSKGRKATRQSNPAPAALKLEDFHYADQLGLALPQLVLAIEIPKRGFEEDARTYQFKLGRTWLKLAHQSAGHACHQHYLLATVLTPKTVKVAQGISALDRKWLDSQAGCWGVPLSGVLDYEADLKRLLGAGCNTSYRSFEEGFFPLDTEFLSAVAAEADLASLPKDLDDLIEWRTGFERVGGSVGRWKLIVLGENSD